MKEKGITGQKGRTPGVVPVRNNHWMQLAAQSQLGPDSSGQQPHRSLSKTTLIYSHRIAHCEQCHTTSGAPASQSIRGQRANPWRNWPDVDVEQRATLKWKTIMTTERKKSLFGQTPDQNDPIYILKSSLKAVTHFQLTESDWNNTLGCD